MGVPKFYRWISERYPSLSEVIREHQIPDFDNLYLDMNGIIHPCAHPNDEDVHFRISEEQILTDIMRYIDFIFRMIKPQKVFFMAVDGVAPRAKMNQQRGRRFRSARDALEREQQARRKGEVLPTEARFDSNCITPGTPFMVRLQQQLEYFVSLKLSSDPLWRGVRVILSGHETPGEGEHKVMDFIRWQRSQPGYDPGTRHCLYGLDADLMMLGMATHEPYFCLLREEIKFIRRKPDDNKSDNKNNKKAAAAAGRKPRTVNPDDITFHLLHLSLLRQYLDHEFAPLKAPGLLPQGYDLERIIDDWVLMGFLNGNDFIPHLPGFHINKNSFQVMYAAYMDVLPRLDGYLNEGGRLRLGRFQKFLDVLCTFDSENFEEMSADLRFLEGKRNKATKPRSRRKNKEVIGEFPDMDLDADSDHIPSASEALAGRPIGSNRFSVRSLYTSSGTVRPGRGPGPEHQSSDGDDEGPSSELSDEYDDEDEDEDADELFSDEFRLHKDRYYADKMNYDGIEERGRREEILREQAHCYIRALQWNLHYYYDGCVSWGWYYPHHYAPYVSDIKKFCDVDLTFELGEPFKPFEQLLAVLPMASKDCLPAVFQRLITNPNSPLKEYYPDTFDLDQNEKIHAWEAIVLIPFIEERKLLSVAREHESGLTAAERARNVHGPHLVYEYTEADLGRYKSPLPDSFPFISHNHAQLAKWPRDKFLIPAAKIRKGLLPAARQRLSHWMAGFATLQYIGHEARLENGKVRVFDGMTSRGDNMMIHILKDERNSAAVAHLRLATVAARFIDKVVYVNWPHLMEAKVVAVTDSAQLYEMNSYTGRLTGRDFEPQELRSLADDVSRLRRIARERRGIVYDQVDFVLYVLPLIGQEMGANGRRRAYYAQNPLLYPLDLVVSGIQVQEASFRNRKRFRAPAGIPLDQQLAQMRSSMLTKPAGVQLDLSAGATPAGLRDLWSSMKSGQGNSSTSKETATGSGPRGLPPPPLPVLSGSYANAVTKQAPPPTRGELVRDMIVQEAGAGLGPRPSGGSKNQPKNQKAAAAAAARRGSSNAIFEILGVTTTTTTASSNTAAGGTAGKGSAATPHSSESAGRRLDPTDLMALVASSQQLSLNSPKATGTVSGRRPAPAGSVNGSALAFVPASIERKTKRVHEPRPLDTKASAAPVASSEQRQALQQWVDDHLSPSGPVEYSLGPGPGGLVRTLHVRLPNGKSYSEELPPDRAHTQADLDLFKENFAGNVLIALKHLNGAEKQSSAARQDLTRIQNCGGGGGGGGGSGGGGNVAALDRLMKSQILSSSPGGTPPNFPPIMPPMPPSHWLAADLESSSPSSTSRPGHPTEAAAAAAATNHHHHHQNSNSAGKRVMDMLHMVTGPPTLSAPFGNSKPAAAAAADKRPAPRQRNKPKKTEIQSQSPHQEAAGQRRSAKASPSSASGPHQKSERPPPPPPKRDHIDEYVDQKIVSQTIQTVFPADGTKATSLVSRNEEFIHLVDRSMEQEHRRQRQNATAAAAATAVADKDDDGKRNRKTTTPKAATTAPAATTAGKTTTTTTTPITADKRKSSTRRGSSSRNVALQQAQ